MTSSSMPVTLLLSRQVQRLRS